MLVYPRSALTRFMFHDPNHGQYITSDSTVGATIPHTPNFNVAMLRRVSAQGRPAGNNFASRRTARNIEMWGQGGGARTFASGVLFFLFEQARVMLVCNLRNYFGQRSGG